MRAVGAEPREVVPLLEVLRGLDGPFGALFFGLADRRRGDALTSPASLAERRGPRDRRGVRPALGAGASRRTAPPDRCCRTTISLSASAAMPSITVLNSARPVTTPSSV